MRHLALFSLLLLSFTAIAQDYAYRTFKDTRVINTHSTETLPKGKLDIRISHRFGDLLGASGGWKTFYGLETAADVMIGGEYGFADNFNMGIYRSKGVGDLRQLVSSVGKYRLLRQKLDEPSSFSLTLLGVGSFSTMERIDDAQFIQSFEKFSHRLIYTAQILVAKKFSDQFSLQISPSFTHRNIVRFDEENDIFSIGTAARFQLTKVIGLLLDATIPITGVQSPFSENVSSRNYTIPLGIGVEFDTGGHVFQVNLTNSTGIIEPDYIGNTTGDWLKGEFRLGFTISRLFNL
jgi:hypothetical protein